MKLLVIDNYDSFVHNLSRYLRCLNATTIVLRNDEVTSAIIQGLAPDAVVLSPGPCTPNEAGYCVQLVRDFSDKLPILGICLGHQAIYSAYAGNVVRSHEPCHGQDSLVCHQNRSVFAGLPNPLRVGRYHSLIAERDSLPAELEITGWLNDGTIMAVQHRRWPTVGLQFHPESILTDHGMDLLKNFLSLVQLFSASRQSNTDATCPASIKTLWDKPTGVAT